MSARKAANVSDLEIRAQLKRIQSSSGFAAGGRVSRFLKFVAEETLAGRAKRIKQYTVAVDGLGFPAEFDPVTSPAVRLVARRLRRALKAYYRKPGAKDPVRIDIPVGTYVPVFEQRPPHEAAPEKNEQPIPVDAQPVDPSYAPPSIVLLPFVYLGRGAEGEQIASGLSAELTIALSACQGLEINEPPPGTVRAKGIGNMRDFARECGVAYVLSGWVQASEGRIRVLTRLVSTRDWTLVWGEVVERELQARKIFEIMADIASQIAGLVGDDHGAIPRFGFEMQAGRSMSPSAYRATLLYRQYDEALSPEVHARVCRALEATVKEDPGCAQGWALLANVYADVYSIWSGHEEWLQKAERCAEKALMLDRLGFEPGQAVGYCRFLRREHGAALHEAEMLMERYPNTAHAAAWGGFLIGLTGQLERGRRIIEQAEQLNPNLPGWLQMIAFFDHLERGEYEQSLRRAYGFGSPEDPRSRLLRAVAAGHLGNETVAADAYQALARDFPDIAAEPSATIAIWLHFDRWVEATLQGLDKAGRFAMRRRDRGVVGVSDERRRSALKSL